MKSLILLITILHITIVASAQLPKWGIDTLGYHKIAYNKTDNSILPWYSSELGKSYNFVVNQVWNFWSTMRTDKNGLPYYMNHQVWRGDFNDRRGVGGDQFAMAMSSWYLYYLYSGKEEVKEEMKFIADYYLTHSLSPKDAAWPNIPYPYNTLVYSGIYDGDMILGPEYTQPDKAGSFGYELLRLHKMTKTFPNTNVTEQRYLNAAIAIANTLSIHTVEGDDKNSPLPFKLNAISGEVGLLKDVWGGNDQKSNYTSNWSGTLELFQGLISMKAGKTEQYQRAFDLILNWMKTYPMKLNKWGPFFEDIHGWSDTQINAVTFAQYIMNHPEYFPEWKTDVKGIFDWVYQKVGNKEWAKYGVIVVNEQTAYQTPGNSHTSRQAAAELQYSNLSGDTSLVANAIRQLNWATYMVDADGKNCYPRDEVWMTDGYGDYVRHYLRSMAFKPELAPGDQNHLLSSTSVVQIVEYSPQQINRFLVPEVPNEVVNNTMLYYKTFDQKSTETIRLAQKPSGVMLNRKPIQEINDPVHEGWTWIPVKNDGGILRINHLSGNRVIVLK